MFLKKVTDPNLRILKISKFGVAAFLVGVLTFVSRLVGLLRTRLMTAKFGAGEELDLYFAAFRVPDLLMGIFIVGTLSLAVLPILTKYLVKDKESVSELLSKLLNRTFILMGLASLVCAVFAPWFIKYFAPGFSIQQLDKAVELTRIILSVQVLLALANVITTALNATKRFFWAAAAPVFYNLGIVVGIVWFYNIYGLAGLGYGVVLGAVLHFLVVGIAILRAGFKWRMGVRNLPAGSEIFKAYIPRLLMFDLSQLGLLLATFYGSRLVSGSISAYNLSFDLQAVPVGVVAVASAVAVFPHLAESFVQEDTKRYVHLLGEAVVKIVFYIAPISVALLIFRAQAVRLVYGAGNFDWNDTVATFTVLGVLSFSLLGQSLVPLFSRALLARARIWAPVISNLVSLVVLLVVASWFVGGLGVSGVGVAYVIAITLNALVLYVWLRRDVAVNKSAREYVEKAESWLAGQMWRVLISLTVFCAVSYGSLYLFVLLFDNTTWLGLALQTGFAAFLGGVVYLALSGVLKVQEALVLKEFFLDQVKTQK